MKLFTCSRTPRSDRECQASSQLAAATFLTRKTPHPAKSRSAPVSPPHTPLPGWVSVLSAPVAHGMAASGACVELGCPRLFTPPPPCCMVSTCWQDILPVCAQCLLLSLRLFLHSAPLYSLQEPALCGLQLAPMASVFQFDFAGDS